jgi:hypothetical protein
MAGKIITARSVSKLRRKLGCDTGGSDIRVTNFDQELR